MGTDGAADVPVFPSPTPQRRKSDSSAVLSPRPMKKSRRSTVDSAPRERPFACTYPNCNKSYTKSSHLKAHIRTHTGERPFACTWKDCSWSFARSDELTRHFRKHTGARPYACAECG